MRIEKHRIVNVSDPALWNKFLSKSEELKATKYDEIISPFAADLTSVDPKMLKGNGLSLG